MEKEIRYEKINLGKSNREKLTNIFAEKNGK
jgi:hypothetical protein